MGGGSKAGGASSSQRPTRPGGAGGRAGAGTGKWRVQAHVVLIAHGLCVLAGGVFTAQHHLVAGSATATAKAQRAMVMAGVLALSLMVLALLAMNKEKRMVRTLGVRCGLFVQGLLVFMFGARAVESFQKGLVDVLVQAVALLLVSVVCVVLLWTSPVPHTKRH